MTLRLIGGAFKGRILKTPKGTATRPTQGMLREAVFNICQNEIEGARFLDLFAGSGAIGLEALSRGAKSVVFVEQNRSALAAIRENIALLKMEAQTQIIPYNVKIALQKLTNPFDIIYIDPPYDQPTKGIIEELIVRNLLCPNGILFLEERSSSKTIASQFEGLNLISSRRFGEAMLHQYSHST